MVSLIAKTTMKLGGKVLKAGDTFELDERYARTLVATRQADRAPDKPKKPAAKKAEKVADEPMESPKKTYKTRQIKAEDSE